MARTARPWYFTEKQAYPAYGKGRRVILLEGEESDANFREAQNKLKQVLKGSRHDQAPASLRVADVIERYLKLRKDCYSERAFAERLHYLQLFAEAHGFRKVNDRDCLPVHAEEWLAEHPQWSSD